MQQAPRLHVPGRLGPGPLTLDGDPARRLGKVMRGQPVNDVLLFNGDGREWHAQVSTTDGMRAILRVGEVARQEPAAALIVETWCGLIEPRRFDWMVEKCTEAGADVIRPFASAHGATWRETSPLRLARWEQLSIEAAELCGRLRLPAIEQPAPFERLLETHRGAGADGDTWESAAWLLPREGRVAVVVGPPGGLTDAELQRARMRGALPLRVGPNVFRTETAAVIATALLRLGVER